MCLLADRRSYFFIHSTNHCTFNPNVPPGQCETWRKHRAFSTSQFLVNSAQESRSNEDQKPVLARTPGSHSSVSPGVFFLDISNLIFRESDAVGNSVSIKVTTLSTTKQQKWDRVQHNLMSLTPSTTVETCPTPLFYLWIPCHPSAWFSITRQWWIEDSLGRPASVGPVSCVPVWVNRGSLISARGLRGGSAVRLGSSLNWQPCSPLLLFVNRCVCLNGSLSVELLHEPMGPKHLSPPRSVLINDSFSAAWGRRGGGGGGGTRGKRRRGGRWSLLRD